MITRQEINGKSPLNYSWYDIKNIDDNDIVKLKKGFILRRLLSHMLPIEMNVLTMITIA